MSSCSSSQNAITTHDKSSPIKSIALESPNEGPPYFDLESRPLEMAISKRKSIWHSLPVHRSVNLNSSNNNNNNNCTMKNKNLEFERTYFETTYEWPQRLEELFAQTPANTEMQLKHAWNPNDRSLNIFIKPEDALAIHRHPVAQSTDCIRGKVGYSRGIHYWEVIWAQRQRGTHPVIGIATKEAPLHCPGYKALIGGNKHSWGWDINKNMIIHNDVEKNLSYVNGLIEKRTASNTNDFVIPDSFGMVLDMEEGTLGFVIDNKYTGIAFGGLKGKTVYPAVNTVWGHCEVYMRYISSLNPQPLSLLETSRRVIEKSIIDKSYTEIFTLPIPTMLKVLVIKNAPSHHTDAIRNEIIRQEYLRKLDQKGREEMRLKELKEKEKELELKENGRKIYGDNDNYIEFSRMDCDDHSYSMTHNNNTVF